MYYSFSYSNLQYQNTFISFDLVLIAKDNSIKSCFKAIHDDFITPGIMTGVIIDHIDPATNGVHITAKVRYENIRAIDKYTISFGN